MNVEYIKVCNRPFLTVCICTLEERKKQFDILKANLLDYSTGYDVDILSICDNRQISVGRKRNLLIDSLHSTDDTSLSAFVDDDDILSPFYFKKIYEASKFFPDVIGMEGIITKNGNDPRKFIHSMKYKEWSEDPIKKIYFRNPNHLNPIRVELVKQVRFKEVNFGEDLDFSMRIYPLLKTEVYIDTPIYYYQYDDRKSATKGR